MRLDYFFDPFCGWCYASAPALEGVATRFAGVLHLHPTGLFANPRPVSAIADHAFRNDTRIGELTGQVFTEAYHRGVMRAPGGIFDSTAATRALVALGEGDAAMEAKLLHELQIARYVEGRDTVQPEEVAAVAATVVSGLEAGAFATRLREDADLIASADARMAEARAGMQAVQANGVPLLLVSIGDRKTILHGQDLYSGAGHLTGLLEDLSGRDKAR